MPDREKVIKWLDVCKTSDVAVGLKEDYPCRECPYKGSARCMRELIADALALLKKQEAKCLSKEDLNSLEEEQYVWIETRGGLLYCLEIIGICRGKDNVTDIQFDTPTAYVEQRADRYGIGYRIWTNRPTDEQQEALKWE